MLYKSVLWKYILQNQDNLSRIYQRNRAMPTKYVTSRLNLSTFRHFNPIKSRVLKCVIRLCKFEHFKSSDITPRHCYYTADKSITPYLDIYRWVNEIIRTYRNSKRRSFEWKFGVVWIPTPAIWLASYLLRLWKIMEVQPCYSDSPQ